MGIKGLWKEVQPVCRPAHISQFRGQRVGVDAYCWLHRAVLASTVALATDKADDKFIALFVSRVELLQRYGVTPVIIFDGASMPMKAATDDQRHQRREAAKQEGLRLLQMGHAEEAYKQLGKSIDVSTEIAYAVLLALKDRDVECIVAPYEADAQLAHLCREGYIQAVISEDSDLMVYKCNILLAKMDGGGNCDAVHIRDIPKCAGFTTQHSHEAFVTTCILSGCDYVASLPSIGIKTAQKLVSSCKSIPDLLATLQNQHGFTAKELGPYEEALHKALYCFTHHLVYDPTLHKVIPYHPLPAHVPIQSHLIGDIWEDGLAQAVCEHHTHDPCTHLPYTGKHKDSVQLYMRVTKRGQRSLNEFSAFERYKANRIVMRQGGGSDGGAGGNSDGPATSTTSGWIGAMSNLQKQQQQQQGGAAILGGSGGGGRMLADMNAPPSSSPNTVTAGSPNIPFAGFDSNAILARAAGGNNGVVLTRSKYFGGGTKSLETTRRGIVAITAAAPTLGGSAGNSLDDTINNNGRGGYPSAASHSGANNTINTNTNNTNTSADAHAAASNSNGGTTAPIGTFRLAALVQSTREYQRDQAMAFIDALEADDDGEEGDGYSCGNAKPFTPTVETATASPPLPSSLSTGVSALMNTCAAALPPSKSTDKGSSVLAIEGARSPLTVTVDDDDDDEGGGDVGVGVSELLGAGSSSSLNLCIGGASSLGAMDDAVAQNAIPPTASATKSFSQLLAAAANPPPPPAAGTANSVVRVGLQQSISNNMRGNGGVAAAIASSMVHSTSQSLHSPLMPCSSAENSASVGVGGGGGGGVVPASNRHHNHQHGGEGSPTTTNAACMATAAAAGGGATNANTTNAASGGVMRMVAGSSSSPLMPNAAPAVAAAPSSSASSTLCPHHNPNCSSAHSKFYKCFRNTNANHNAVVTGNTSAAMVNAAAAVAAPPPASVPLPSSASPSASAGLGALLAAVADDPTPVRSANPPLPPPPSTSDGPLPLPLPPHHHYHCDDTGGHGTVSTVRDTMMGVGGGLKRGREGGYEDERQPQARFGASAPHAIPLTTTAGQPNVARSCLVDVSDDDDDNDAAAAIPPSASIHGTNIHTATGTRGAAPPQGVAPANNSSNNSALGLIHSLAHQWRTQQLHRPHLSGGGGGVGASSSSSMGSQQQTAASSNTFVIPISSDDEASNSCVGTATAMRAAGARGGGGGVSTAANATSSSGNVSASTRNALDLISMYARGNSVTAATAATGAGKSGGGNAVPPSTTTTTKDRVASITSIIGRMAASAAATPSTTPSVTTAMAPAAAAASVSATSTAASGATTAAPAKRSVDDILSMLAFKRK